MADLLTPARLHAVEANVALRSSPFSYLISSPRVLDPIDKLTKANITRKRHGTIDSVDHLRQEIERHKREEQAKLLRLSHERQIAEQMLLHQHEEQRLNDLQERDEIVNPLREEIASLKLSAAADALAKGLAIIHLKYQRAFQEVLANVTERAAELKISIEGNFFKIVRRALLDVLTGMEPPILPILKEAFEAHPAFEGEGVWAGYLDGVSASFPVTIDVVARMNPANAFVNRVAGNPPIPY